MTVSERKVHGGNCVPCYAIIMASKAPPYNTPSLVGTPSGPGQGLRSLQTSQRSSIAKPTQ